MSNKAGPHHAEERSKSRKTADHRKTTIGYETPTPRKPMRPSSRLGPVHSATPTRKTFGGVAGGYANEFLEARRRRQLRHAARLAKLPKDTLIVGGVNPFEQKNLREASKKFREAVVEMLSKGAIGVFTPAASAKKMNNPTSQKLVFREEEEEPMEVDEEEESVILIAGGGDGGDSQKKRNNNNRTIVIDD